MINRSLQSIKSGEITTIIDFHLLIDYVVILYMIAYAALDSLNGFILKNGISSISLAQIIKSLIILLILFRFFSSVTQHKKNVLIAVLFIGFLSMNLLHALRFQNFQLFISDLAITIKWVVPVITFYYFLFLKERRPALTNKYFIPIVVVNFAVVAINLILGILGYGFDQYSLGAEERGVGTSGFFYAGNELSALMIAVFGMIIAFAWNKSLKSYLIISAFCMVLALFKITKVAIAGVFFLVIAIPFLDHTIKLFKVSFSFLKKSFVLMLVSVPVLIIGFIFLKNSGLFSRLEYFYDHLDLVSVIFSSRNVMAAHAFDFIAEEYTLFDYLFGIGARQGELYMLRYAGDDAIVEIDFIDLMIQYGLVGLVTIYTFWIFLVYRAYKLFKQGHTFYKYVAFINLCLFGLAHLSGHVFNSAMLGFMLSFINVLPDLDGQQIRFLPYKIVWNRQRSKSPEITQL
jgi:hypothetical protein